MGFHLFLTLVMVYASADSSFHEVLSKMTTKQQKEAQIMKSTYETMGGKYRQDGDYLLPNFEVPEYPQVGVWGERRRKYMREHQKARYTAMMLSDTLNAHLEEVDRSATEMFDRLIEQLKHRDGITEELKASRQLEWVQRMTVIRQEAAEIVTKELICV